MARADKAAAVAELTDELRNSTGAVLTEYRGLSVKQLQQLRRALGANARYAVVKNTLTQIAVREAGVTSFDGLLTGPTAIAFIKGDPVEAAKDLRDFARTHPPLLIKAGYLEGRTLTAEEIAKVADLESREALLSQAAGVFNASLQRAASLFQAPLSQAARLAAALQEKKAEGEATGPAPEAAAESAEPAEEQGAEQGAEATEQGTETTEA
jgi:large subunit ribosomal protein L10